jgi:RHS repeat-associated protein
VNGNIGGIKWKSRSDGKGRAYGYAYDNANRLLVADFTQNNPAGSNSWDATQLDFSVNQLVYDPNGNILSMRQKGMNGTAIQTIDSLKYGYLLNSNKLWFVTDRKNNSLSQLGDFKEIINNETVDYTYDFNGNMVKDLNKNIDTIRYNHLNLPDSIVIKGKGNIRYWYDAAGNKLRKIVTDNTGAPAKITTTDYIGGFVYRNDTLELISHEEGRIRPVYVAGQPVKYYYDYFLKDHLGNVRTVLTEQTDLSAYTATMEAANAPTEAALFSNVEETRTEKPVGYPEDHVAGDNQYVAKLNAKNGKKIGPSLVLKVMAGDTIQIGARAFYKSTGPKDSKSVSPEDMVAGLLQAFRGGAGEATTHGASQVDRVSPFGNFNGSDYQRLKERDADQNQQDKPKAYLNFVLFDDQFNLVEENSGVRQVKGEPDELQTLAVDKMPITKSGFLYVYTSNETEQDVLFDNVTVLAASGPLLEETHYYPYGLTMAGISSNALKGMNYVENRKKYNGIEFTEDLELDIYDAFYRNLDPQIGRWNQIDPKTEKMEMWSPYASNYDNPIRFNDFLGDEGDDPTKRGFIAGVKTGFVDYFKNIGNAVSHPVQTVKAAFSPKALLNNALDASTVGLYGMATKSYNNLQTIVKEGAYGAGKIVGDKAADGVVVLGTEGIGRAASAIKSIGKESAALGDLTTKEVKQIQSVVDQAERPIEVVGSAAAAERRGVGTNLPMGKGPGTRSDIDYVAPPSSLPYFDGVKGNLPSLDPKTGIIPGTGNPFIGPIIRFEPGAKPSVILKQNG